MSDDPGGRVLRLVPGAKRAKPEDSQVLAALEEAVGTLRAPGARPIVGYVLVAVHDAGESGETVGTAVYPGRPVTLLGGLEVAKATLLEELGELP